MEETGRHPLFDMHTHVLQTNCCCRTSVSQEEVQSVSSSPLKALTDSWFACGVSGGILTQPSFYRFDNSILLDVLKCHNQRNERQVFLAGVIVFNWSTVSLEKIEEWSRQGIVGVRLNYFRGKPEDLPNWGSNSANRVLGWLRTVGWHVNIYADAADLPAILPTLLEHNVKIVINHFGMPHFSTKANKIGFAWMLNTARDSPKLPLFVTMSGDFRFSKDSAFVAARVQELLGSVGENRLLWASDFPFTRYEALGLSVSSQYAKFRDWIPNSELQRKILCTNFRKVLGLGAR